jgi:hypothetical protein
MTPGNRPLLGVGTALCLAVTACTSAGQSETTKAPGDGAPTKTPGDPPPTRTPSLPDGSFEGQPSEWGMGPNAVIQGSVAHGGARALRVELDHGLGSREVTRSAYFGDIDVGPEYVLTFWYRYESCKSAVFTLSIGDYEKKLRLEGSDSSWQKGSIVVSFAKKPAWVDVTAGRLGSADQYAGPEYDDNVLWLDDIEIAPR